VIVSCRNLKGENNALAVAYASWCSFDPHTIMIGIVPSRYSHHMVKETNVFVVNVVTEKMREMYQYLGSVSRRDEDKLAKISWEEGIKVPAPVLIDSPLNIECRVEKSILVGSHELFFGKVEYIHCEEEYLKENGIVNLSSLRLIQY